MGLQRERIRTYVLDLEGVMQERVAIITHQDMMRAEKAVMDTPGGNISAAVTLATAWCWASLMRQGDYSGAWQQFRDQDCQGMEDMEAVDVDPSGRAMIGDSP